jgi:hypothetical protein
MTWDLFGYICRKSSVDCKGNEHIRECLKRVKNEKICEVYSGNKPIRGLPKLIINKIEQIEDPSKARKVIDIYKDLKLNNSFEIPKRFKRVFSYLFVIFIVFCSIAGVYHLKVLPSFIDAFKSFNLELPESILLYQQYWIYFVLIILLLFISALIIGLKIRSLLQFTEDVERGVLFNYLLFKRIKTSYLRIVEIALFPLQEIRGVGNQNKNLIIDHLNSIKKTNLNLSVEMSALIDIELKRLLDNCEAQMKLVSVVIASLILVAVFCFIISAYSPMFIIGDVI